MSAGTCTTHGKRSYNIRSLERGNPHRYSLLISYVWVFLYHQAILPQQLGILRMLLTWRGCQIPQVKGSVQLDCLHQSPSTDSNHKFRLSTVLLTKRLQSEDSHDLSLG